MHKIDDNFGWWERRKVFVFLNDLIKNKTHPATPAESVESDTGDGENAEEAPRSVAEGLVRKQRRFTSVRPMKSKPRRLNIQEPDQASPKEQALEVDSETNNQTVTEEVQIEEQHSTDNVVNINTHSDYPDYLENRTNTFTDKLLKLHGGLDAGNRGRRLMTGHILSAGLKSAQIEELLREEMARQGGIVTNKLDKIKAMGGRQFHHIEGSARKRQEEVLGHLNILNSSISELQEKKAKVASQSTELARQRKNFSLLRLSSPGNLTRTSIHRIGDTGEEALRWTVGKSRAEDFGGKAIEKALNNAVKLQGKYQDKLSNWKKTQQEDINTGKETHTAVANALGISYSDFEGKMADFYQEVQQKGGNKSIENILSQQNISSILEDIFKNDLSLLSNILIRHHNKLPQAIQEILTKYRGRIPIKDRSILELFSKIELSSAENRKIRGQITDILKNSPSAFRAHLIEKSISRRHEQQEANRKKVESLRKIFNNNHHILQENIFELSVQGVGKLTNCKIDSSRIEYRDSKAAAFTINRYNTTGDFNDYQIDVDMTKENNPIVRLTTRTSADSPETTRFINITDLEIGKIYNSETITHEAA
jgi:hypothetical protein